MENGKEERAKMKVEFLKKYPNADLSKFEFDVDLNQDGTIDSTTIFFKNNQYLSTDITSATFLNNKSMTKYLYLNVKAIFPKLWNTGGTIQELPRGRRRGFYW